MKPNFSKTLGLFAWAAIAAIAITNVCSDTKNGGATFALALALTLDSTQTHSVSSRLSRARTGNRTGPKRPPPSPLCPPTRSVVPSLGLRASNNSNNNNIEDEVYTPSLEDSTSNQNFLDDLTPPPVNFARNSILFSENPSTKIRNNPPLELWKFCRTYLPPVITGAWPWRDTEALDDQPLAALYNVVLVRLPVVAVAISYLYQKLSEGHDLVMDLGFDSNGPQVVPPVLVIAILVLILL